MGGLRNSVQSLFGMTERVGRGRYLRTGLALMALKYAVDAALAFAVTGEIFEPWQYLNPVIDVRLDGLPLPGWAVFVMVAWAVPFLWIGLSMSLRRALDAGYRPNVALLFLLPFANLVLIAWLCAAPSRSVPADDPWRERHFSEARIQILALMIGICVSLVLTALSTQVIGAYGSGLFLGVPVLIGFVSGWLANRSARRSLGATIALASWVILMSGLSVLLFALEGVLCLVMAAPLALAFAALGAALGRAWATRIATAGAVAGILLLPLLMGAEHHARGTPPLRAVASEVLIAAPPEAVWDHVIGFSELPPPSEAIFALGIAYPIRAEIRGSGPGAVRHCVFSTGPFVEPVTVWEPPHRLAFDVTSQPPGMRETSPYNHVYAPHLDGYPTSVRGEFRLHPVAGGHTRLVGTTWYRLGLFPQAYWTPLSDALIHTIHLRVLAHIKALGEHPRAAPAQ